MLGAAVVVIVFLFLLFMIVATYASRVQKVGPNEAMILSGMEMVNGKTGEREAVRIITAGWAFVWPILQRVDRLSLALMPVEVQIEDAYTSDDQVLSLNATAQVKIAGDDAAIRAAAERFLGKPDSEITRVAHDVIKNHLYEQVRQNTQAYIRRERRVFAQQIQESASHELAALGLEIDVFTIKTMD